MVLRVSADAGPATAMARQARPAAVPRCRPRPLFVMCMAGNLAGVGDRWRRSQGTYALRVSELGADCLVCEASWLPEEFHWLARLLGCEAPPAV